MLKTIDPGGAIKRYQLFLLRFSQRRNPYFRHLPITRQESRTRTDHDAIMRIESDEFADSLNSIVIQRPHLVETINQR